MLWTVVVMSFGTAKIVKSLEGGNVVVTWLDGILGVAFGIMYVLNLHYILLYLKSGKTILVRSL